MYRYCKGIMNLKQSDMRRGILILAVLFSISTFAQEVTPKFEKEGKMIKATYFHDNGEIAQTGYMVDGKLHGQWYMYSAEGKKVATGKYNHGKRAGKWLFWNGDILKEVDFVENRIATVKNWNQSEIVSVNK